MTALICFLGFIGLMIINLGFKTRKEATEKYPVIKPIIEKFSADLTRAKIKLKEDHNISASAMYHTLSVLKKNGFVEMGDREFKILKPLPESL